MNKHTLSRELRAILVLSDKVRKRSNQPTGFVTSFPSLVVVVVVVIIRARQIGPKQREGSLS